jgi:hypothetical protein
VASGSNKLYIYDIAKVSSTPQQVGMGASWRLRCICVGHVCHCAGLGYLLMKRTMQFD